MSKEKKGNSFANQLKKRFSTTATKAGQRAKDAATVLRYMNTCENLKPYFSLAERSTYRALITAILARDDIDDPYSVIYNGTTGKGRIILLSLTHHKTKTGKIKTTPTRYAYYIDKNELVDEYQEVIYEQAYEEQAFAEERAKDAEARKRRSRGIVVSWGK